jgi:hypothetical protein
MIDSSIGFYHCHGSSVRYRGGLHNSGRVVVMVMILRRRN